MGVDALTFHLPNIGRWIQSGTFWRIDEFGPLHSPGHYPQNGDVVFLSTILPFDNEALVSLVGPVFVALAGLAVYALATETGAARASAVLFATVFASLPVISFTAYDRHQTDPVMLAMWGAGAFFLLRQFRTGRRSDLVLSGVALGLALGTKWYGVWSAAVVIAVWAAASLVDRRSLVSIVKRGAVLSGLVLLFGGFWLLRNLVESGNPVVPVEVQVLGVTIFEAARDFLGECAGFAIADYLGDGPALRDYIWPGLRSALGIPGAVIALGAATGVGLIVIRGRGPRRRYGASQGPAVALLAAACLLAAAYAVTPFSAFGPEGQPLFTAANSRYLLPALLVGAALGGWAVSRLGGARPFAELLALVAVLDGIRRGFDVRTSHVVAAALAVGLLAAGGFWVVRSRPSFSRTWRMAAVAAAVGVALLFAGVGYERQKDLNRNRYLGSDSTIDWILRNAPEGQHVALAGTWTLDGITPVWPAFGTRLGNEVDYLGHLVHGQLREYDSRSRWRSALGDGEFDLLLVGLARTSPRGDCIVPGSSSNDDAFARASGLIELARSDRLVLYRVPQGVSRPPA